MQQNNKLWGFDGVLNRRNFIANILIIEILEGIIFTSPMFILTLIKPSLMTYFLQAPESNSLLIYPLWMTIWFSVLAITQLVLYYSSFTRRIRDIVGGENSTRIGYTNFAISIMIIASLPLNIIPSLFRIFSFGLLIFLMCKKGTEQPTSEVVKFNWGAMLGTWIWGLSNKLYKTLWALPIFILFPTSILPLMIYFGIKGNEWVFENKEEETTIEEFHKKQEKQTLIYSILFPILCILFLIISFVSFAYYAVKMYSSDDILRKVENYTTEIVTSGAKAIFSEIKIEDGKYEFYISPKKWDALTPSAKENAFRTANIYALENSKDKIRVTDKGYLLKQIEIATKTVIKSTYNNEVLAEYNIDLVKLKEMYDKSIKEKDSFNDIIKYQESGYKFNYHPSLP